MGLALSLQGVTEESWVAIIVTRTTFGEHLSHTVAFIGALVTFALEAKFAHLTWEFVINRKIWIFFATVKFSMAELTIVAFLKMHYELVV